MPNRRRLLIIAAVLLAALFFGAQTVRWSGESGAERAQRKFLGYIEGRRWSKCHRMISANYADRWGFDRDQLSLALQDVGGHFLFSLIIEWTKQGTAAADGGSGFAVTGSARLDGSGGPLADVILREINAYAAEPFTFHWRREGLLPWKWKLVRVDHPSVEVPDGYTPGSLGSAGGVGF